ncbi:MAG: hypothetical protein J5842_06430 [Lachnospiraceae bacterium]|nr:hypothetical protein [Lachnospiraceae bacterium]
MYNKKQRIAALIGLVLIFLLLIGLIVTAIFDISGLLFKAFLFAVIAVPILIWIYIWLFGKMTGKKTIADFNLGRDPSSDASRTDKDTEGSAAAAEEGDASSSVTVSKNPMLRK